MAYDTFFNPEYESLSRSEIEVLQLDRLKATINLVYYGSPFYRKRLDAAGISPSEIRTLDDLRRIPFTTKQDLRDNYPFGMASVPLSKCVRLHASSGTTGNPTVILNTSEDIRQWGEAVARCLWMAGCRPEDTFQIIVGYGLFTGGLGFQYGAERLGMLTVPASVGNTLDQINYMTDFGTTALHIIPSYASRLYEVMCKKGIVPKRDLQVKTIILGAEPHSKETRNRIENMFGAKTYNLYGLSEMCGPGVAAECTERNGLHLLEDNYIAEIVDPKTLEPVRDGQVGELVLTTLNREAMPLLRYRTRDLTCFLPGDCACGRAHKRIASIMGRSDDMIILKGVNIFPSQIEAFLMKFSELSSDYIITLETINNNDAMTVEVEYDGVFGDNDFSIQSLERTIACQLKDEILITPTVRLVPKGSLPKTEGKVIRVQDLRK